MKKCIICCEMFTPRDGSQANKEICGRYLCRLAYTNGMKKAVKQGVCEICGELFPIKVSKYWTRTCSDECKSELLKRIHTKKIDTEIPLMVKG